MIKLYKKLSLITPRTWLILLLAISFLFRFIRLSNPTSYIFDEVYHVVTARDYSKGTKAAYNPFSPPPEPNTAYDWLHPPLAKLIQASSIRLIGDHSLAWRLPSALFGTLSIAALYYFSFTLFKNKRLSFLAATLFSFDNLQLTMSRITMNDIFVTTWILLALTFFYKLITDKARPCQKKHLLLTGLFTGLAIATKWSSLFIYPIFSLFLFKKIIKNPKLLIHSFIFLGILPLTIYLLSYTQYFLLGFSLKDFYHLHQQIYWYQTGLTATHDYQSAAWQWPLLIRPVWLHVQYLTNKVAHIYNLGNPAIFWGGLIATVSLLKQKITKANRFLLISYFLFFIPWLFSPRILFLHHYLPSLPFLCLIIAHTIYQNNSLTKKYLLLVILLFLFFYPLNTALPLPTNWLKLWFWLPSWK